MSDYRVSELTAVMLLLPQKRRNALAQAAELSGGRMKADHLTLGMSYELNGDGSASSAARDEDREFLHRLGKRRMASRCSPRDRSSARGS
ncbi:MAG TPA: hypothetical protein VEM96_08560 [Pyrinomonadaceae bacterium]|nr:hypothetical protein [Pyrinomonadaceae bacterium]